MPQTLLRIEGMTCDHCVRAVERALASVQGVQKVQVSLEQKEARLTHPGELDLPAVLQAVEEEGYRASLGTHPPQ